jgi:hypothetical protein
VAVPVPLAVALADALAVAELVSVPTLAVGRCVLSTETGDDGDGSIEVDTEPVDETVS